MQRRRSRLAVTAVLAVLSTGCGSQATTTHVPRIIGLKLRNAEQRLFDHHLRWRVAPGTHVYAKPLPATEHISTDDIPVTGQKPAAGTKTKSNAVVAIITPCTATHPCS